MVTKRRECYPGAIYHITNRGNRQEIIFREEADYGNYLSILKSTLKFYEEEDYKLINYCFMSNHVHLLLKTAQKDPSFFMRRVNSMYAKYFNNKYEYIGHVFQGRYFSNIITNVIELLEVSRYIHLNPVRANIVKKPEDYRWSSYNKIVSKDKEGNNLSYISVDEILNVFDMYFIVEDNNNENLKKKVRQRLDSRGKYKQFVEEKIKIVNEE